MADKEKSDKPVDLAPEAIGAMTQLPPDLALMKMENENIMAAAVARPRNYKVILADIKAQIEAYPSFAKLIIYCKPVGTDPQTGKMKHARGLSIRAAEALAEAYMYNRVKTDTSPVDANRVKIEATFTDYQKGRIWQTSALVSRMYKRRGGAMAMHDDDRFYGVVCKAEASKLVRECIIRSVPAGLRSELMQLAEAEMEKLLDDKEVENILVSFKKLNVSAEQIETFLGRTRETGWTLEDRLNLIGVWNGIKDGETTVEEAFGKGDKPEVPSGPVTAGDLTKPQTDNGQQPMQDVAASGGKTKRGK